MRPLLFLSPVFGIPTFFTRILWPVTSHNQWRPMNDVSLDGITSGKNLQCKSSESEMELERFKRLVYTLHPKATSLRMHSMRKRRVTTKFTMVKKSNKTGGAWWYYKIHPTHRRNTTQTLIFLYAPCIYVYIYILIRISLCPFLISLCVFDRSLSDYSSRPRKYEHYYWIGEEIFFSSKINLTEKYVCLLLIIIRNYNLYPFF